MSSVLNYGISTVSTKPRPACFSSAESIINEETLFVKPFEKILPLDYVAPGETVTLNTTQVNESNLLFVVVNEDERELDGTDTYITYILPLDANDGAIVRFVRDNGTFNNGGTNVAVTTTAVATNNMYDAYTGTISDTIYLPLGMDDVAAFMTFKFIRTSTTPLPVGLVLPAWVAFPEGL